MSWLSSLTLPALTLAGGCATYWAARYALDRSPLMDLPSPPRSSLLLGHFREAVADDEDLLGLKWMKEYGHVYKFYFLFNSPRVVITDLKAIGYILANPDAFPKPDATQNFLRYIFGDGLLVSQGAAHRMQRKIMNPAFGPTQLRELTGIFLDKANELRDVWIAALDHAGGAPARVDALYGFTNAALDIIGLAGFGYEFGALARPADAPSELADAFVRMFSSTDVTAWNMLQLLFPVLLAVPTAQNRSFRHGRRVLERIGAELIAERKAMAAAGEKPEASGRDLLSLLIRANMAENAASRLSDEAVLAQIPTFMLAGHETTSTALSWALLEICQHPELQAELCAELRALPLPRASAGCAPLDADTLGALDKLPLLDAVLRETLRLHPPTTDTPRAPTHDVAVPLARPFVDAHGAAQDTLHIPAGVTLYVPISTVNRAEDLWGPDAMEWNPRRWLGGTPEAARAVPAVWGNILTFIGGPRSCIGYRFMILETKIILHALLSELRFELAVPASDMGRKSTNIVVKPVVKTEPEKGYQLPVLVSRVAAD